MLQQGLQPDCADYDGRTALMLAAGHGHAQAVAMLLAAGANPSACDSLEVRKASSRMPDELDYTHFICCSIACELQTMSQRIAVL